MSWGFFLNHYVDRPRKPLVAVLFSTPTRWFLLCLHIKRFHTVAGCPDFAILSVVCWCAYSWCLVVRVWSTSYNASCCVSPWNSTVDGQIHRIVCHPMSVYLYSASRETSIFCFLINSVRNRRIACFIIYRMLKIFCVNVCKIVHHTLKVAPHYLVKSKKLTFNNKSSWTLEAATEQVLAWSFVSFFHGKPFTVAVMWTAELCSIRNQEVCHVSKPSSVHTFSPTFSKSIMVYGRSVVVDIVIDWWWK